MTTSARRSANSGSIRTRRATCTRIDDGLGALRPVQPYRAVQPPSTMNVCPSTYADSRERRNTMVGANSSGPSILPRGVFSTIQPS